MVRIFILAALAAVAVAAPADTTQAVIDPVQADTLEATDAVNRERKSYGAATGGSYTICNAGGPPHIHYGGLPSPAWAQAPAHGHISYAAPVPVHVAPAYQYGYGGHYRAGDGGQQTLDLSAQAAASAGAAQQFMEQRSAVYMGENNQRSAEEAGNANIDQSFLQSQRAAEIAKAQQMFYQQQQQQRAVNQMQQAEFGKNEQMMAASSNQAMARSAYGGAAAAPFYASGAGSAVGVFPGVLNGGGCGNAIPLLLSCSPNLVQGHVLPQGHGGAHTSNFGISGVHGGIGGGYSSYGAPVYREADGASPQTPHQPHQTQQPQIMQQTQHQAQQMQQPQQNHQQHLQQQQQNMQSPSSVPKESTEHGSAVAKPTAPAHST